MSGDYSRVRFDPRIDIAGVQMQQGRVQLDSDWNEWMAVQDRRMRAESVDTFGVHPMPGITGVAVVSPQTPDAFKIGVAIGPGLYGEYFDDINLSNCTLSRTDATINFDWGSGSPDPLIGADTFSVRWSGSVLAPSTGNYTFHTVSDDGVRLWVNNQLLIDNWTDHAATENSGGITLTAGQKYNIKLEYYENGGAAVIKLLWTPPQQAKQTIPQTQLYPPSISIGIGRMYVDGLLAENHGGGAAEFDSVLAEIRGKDALAFDNQPYYRNPILPSGNGPHLAYLEVWQREVTYLQQPDLVEIAVGVDTTTRLQTVWQIRMLANVDIADCSTPDDSVPKWQDLTRPSSGRMSVKAVPAAPDLGPCELPPGGGYRGLENQLYRIEIHEGGGLGTAKFKWSRNNASVESNVVEIVSQSATSTELKLASLGRDAVLRFNTGDWVEILDDRRELDGEGGNPGMRRGEMRKITVDDTKRTISFSPALPADLIPAGGNDTLISRHTRVKLWDQKGNDLDAQPTPGLIPVPTAGTWVELESGIQVQFSIDAVGGEFHSGDYWVSAARTANTTVEEYTAMPPRGIHRHYARLSIVTLPGDATDCRIMWPPECGGCCTVNVAPGESIQAAIDSLPVEGGCVCLKTGVHKISQTIQILSSRIILHGESPGTIVRSEGLPTSLQIGSPDIPVSDIIVEDICFEALSARGAEVNYLSYAAKWEIGAMLDLQSCTRVRVEHCALVVASLHGTAPSVVGINLNGVTEVELIANRLNNFLVGILSRDYQVGLHIAENTLSGITGAFLDQKAAGSMGHYGIRINTDYTNGCRIENNSISDFWTGIYLGPQATGSLIANNRINRSSGNTNEKPPTDAATTRTYLDGRLYAIDVIAAQCDLRDNYIDLLSAAYGAIRVSGPHTTIAANTITATTQENALTVPAGIYCLADAKRGYRADCTVVRDNQLQGPQSGIVVSGIAEPVVSDNHIDGGGQGWYGIWVDDCTDGRIENNNLREIFFAVHLSQGERNRIKGNGIDLAGTGITSMQEANLEITGNSLQSCVLFGIGLIVRGNTALLQNRVLNCGYASALSIGLGICVFAEELWAPSGAHLRIDDCEVIDIGISADGKQYTSGNAIGICGWIPACQINGNRVGYTQPNTLDQKFVQKQEHRTLLLTGPLALNLPTGKENISTMFGSAQVSDNHFRGPGLTMLVEFKRFQFKFSNNINLELRFENVTFNNNICDHLNSKPSERGASVTLWGGHLIVMGNHVRASDSNVNSILSDGIKIVLMGNITTGNYINSGTVTPQPATNFNVQI